MLQYQNTSVAVVCWSDNTFPRLFSKLHSKSLVFSHIWGYSTRNTFKSSNSFIFFLFLEQFWFVW